MYVIRTYIALETCKCSGMCVIVCLPFSLIFTRSGFLPLLHQAAKICDDTVEVATKQQITNFVCFLSQDPEGNDWKNPRPFYEVGDSICTLR